MHKKSNMFDYIFVVICLPSISLVFLNNSVKICCKKMKIDMLYRKNSDFRCKIFECICRCAFSSFTVKNKFSKCKIIKSSYISRSIYCKNTSAQDFQDLVRTNKLEGFFCQKRKKK